MPDEQDKAVAQNDIPTPSTDEIDELKKKCEEHLAGWKRALADYDNLKKDTAKEKAEYRKYASENIIYDILPILDGMDAVMKHFPSLIGVPEESAKAIENWKAGVVQVQKMLIAIADSNGVSKVSVDGLFNTTLHESAEERDSDEPDGTILEIVSQGYKLHDKLLRPARVIISRMKTK